MGRKKGQLSPLAAAGKEPGVCTAFRSPDREAVLPQNDLKPQLLPPEEKGREGMRGEGVIRQPSQPAYPLPQSKV